MVRPTLISNEQSSEGSAVIKKHMGKSTSCLVKNSILYDSILEELVKE